MTPQQQVDLIRTQIKEAARWMTREQFVTVVNLQWDAQTASEAALQPRQELLTFGRLEQEREE